MDPALCKLFEELLTSNTVGDNLAETINMLKTMIKEQIVKDDLPPWENNSIYPQPQRQTLIDEALCKIKTLSGMLENSLVVEYLLVRAIEFCIYLLC